MVAELSKILSEIDKVSGSELVKVFNAYQTKLAAVEFAKLTGILNILLSVSKDDEILLAAMLLAALAADNASQDEIAEKYSINIQNLVTGVHQLGFVHELSTEKITNQDRHKESLRKMLLSMSRDIRVVFIKLAEQLYMLRNIKTLPKKVHRTLAEETQNIFAPLANRLGIWIFKWELEDLSFRELNPDKYAELAQKLDETRIERETYIEKIKQHLGVELKKLGIEYNISGRSKHIYSIWRKMQLKDKDFDELYDLRAVRVLTDSKENCYQVLGVVHNLWTPIPKEFDDYISNPKANNYQSLHTAVRALNNKVIEIQIRTFEMHDFAESGVAAHWRYKENTKYDPGFEAKVKWLRQLMSWQYEVKEQDGALDNFADKLAPEHIYVFSPAGEVMELPQGSTPLDFAYMIHTELGHRTRGAKVDNKIVPLTYKLKTAQSVEIMTAKEGKPARDWMMSSLGYLRTASARAKVKSWFRKNDYAENVSTGRSILTREAKRLRASLNIADLVKKFNCPQEEDMLVKIALGEISLNKLAAAFQAETVDRQKALEFTTKPVRTKAASGIAIEGVGQLLTTTASCCNPLPGDPIVGFVTKGKGVSIHREDCQNAMHLAEVEAERILKVNWGEKQKDTYEVDILVSAYDRPDLLKDITTLLANEKVTISSLNTKIDHIDNIHNIKIGLVIKDLEQLSKVSHKLEQFKNVISATRI